MAKPVKDAKLKAQTIWPDATVSARGKGHIVHQHPTNPDRFMLDTQVGGRGWHFGDSPFTEANEVDTAWVDALPADAPWQKRMVLADYNAYAFREATLGFDQGQLIEYVRPESGEAVNFQPMQLQWTNDLDQISPIADPQAVPATIEDDVLKWVDAYGAGIDFRWRANTCQLAKYVDIASLADLGSPPQFIIDGGNPVLRVELLFQKSAGVEIWVDGVLWDEKANNPQSTLNNVEFRLAGETLWWFRAPIAWDTGSRVRVYPEMRLRASAQNLFVEILTPWSWLETASYPVTIDATIDQEVDASSDDAEETGAGAMDLTDAEVDLYDTVPHHGIRFDGVALDGTETINADTYISLWIMTYTTIECDIQADDVDDAPTFTTTANNITDRTDTTASVVWSATGTSSQYENSPNISSVVSEIIVRGGWATGQAIAFLLHYNATCDFSYQSWDHGGTDAPQLHIDYTAAAAGTDVDVPVGTLVIAGKVPTVVTTGNVDIDVPLGTLIITGLVPTVATPVNIPVPVGTLVITGNVPTVATPRNVPVPVAALVITTKVPSIGWSGGVTVPIAALVITGKPPTAIATTGTEIEVPLAPLVITGKVPSIGWSGSAVPPVAVLIITGYAVTAVGGVGIVVGAYPQPPTIVAPPPRDVSFPVDRFYAALDNEARKMRTVVNQAYKEAEEEAEELKRRARYARDEALVAIYNDLRQVNLRMKELDQSKTDIRSMQMRRRLEDARTKKPEPEPKPKKKKDMRPKLTKLKKKEYKKRR